MKEEEKDYIILLPFMAQGHLRPFLHLATILSHKPELIITILTTPLNAVNLRQKITKNYKNIIISELPFNGKDYDLPENVENTEKLPLTHVINLFHSAASLEPHVEEYIKCRLTRPPLAVIFDNFLGWGDRVARKFGSVGIAFTTSGAYGTTAYISIWGNLPHKKRDDDEEEEEFVVPGFPENKRFSRDRLHRFVRFANGDDIWSRFFQPQINLSLGCSGWLVNSVEEVEPLGFELLRSYLKLPVWGIGPLISSPSPSPNDECIKWLNTKDKDSVLYISFGSQNTINPTQMMELASGLEMSGKSFLWVIRPPSGFDINGEFKPEWLPNGFEERVKGQGRGMVVHKWGPQLEILSHEAVGGFLSHCGWNSVLEGLREGVGIIGWPLAGEQAYNVKMLVDEMGVAVEMVRIEGEVGREVVAKVVETVLDRVEGSVGWEIKRKVVDVGRKLKDAANGSSIKVVDDFLDFVSTRTRSATSADHGS